MKKIICLSVILLVTHGTVLSMMHTRKVMKSVSRIQLQKRTHSEGGLIDHVGDAAFLRTASAPSNLMNRDDISMIRETYRESIRQIARIEAMGKIYVMPGLNMHQQKELLEEADKILTE